MERFSKLIKLVDKQTETLIKFNSGIKKGVASES